MTIYKSFADLATMFGPVIPSTKEIEAEYGPAIDPIPAPQPEGPKVWVRYTLPEENVDDYGEDFWRKWKQDFASWLVAGSTFFDFDERSQFDPIQFIDKVLQGLERMRDTAEDAGKQTKEAMAEFDRMNNGTEIDIERYRMLKNRLDMLRLKYRRTNKAFEAGMVARERCVGQSGLKTVDPYMSLERLAGLQRSKVERQRREFQRMLAAEKLLGLTPEQLRERQNRAKAQLLDTTMANLAHNGIDSDDGAGGGRAKQADRGYATSPK